MADQEIEQLKKRLARLEDIEEIRKLRSRYGYLVHDAKIDELMSLFSEDASGDYTYGQFKNKAALRDFFTRMRPRPVNMSHNAVIEVHGDRATAEWYYTGSFASKANTTTLVGKYEEEYVREGGMWKFRKIKAREIMAPVVKIERNLERGA